MSTLVHQLELVPLTRDSWRVCDRAVASSDAGSIVAYVESRGRVFEVAWVAAGLGVEVFTDLEGVLKAAFELLSGGEDMRSRAGARITLVPSEPSV